jgi:hypothetical protein
VARVLGLPGLPAWLVSAASLPKDVPAGPGAGEVTRLGAAGLMAGSLSGLVRRRRRARTSPDS